MGSRSVYGQHLASAGEANPDRSYQSSAGGYSYSLASNARRSGPLLPPLPTDPPRPTPGPNPYHTPLLSVPHVELADFQTGQSSRGWDPSGTDELRHGVYREQGYRNSTGSGGSSPGIIDLYGERSPVTTPSYNDAYAAPYSPVMEPSHQYPYSPPLIPNVDPYSSFSSSSAGIRSSRDLPLPPQRPHPPLPPPIPSRPLGLPSNPRPKHTPSLDPPSMPSTPPVPRRSPLLYSSPGPIDELPSLAERRLRDRARPLTNEPSRQASPTVDAMTVPIRPHSSPLRDQSSPGDQGRGFDEYDNSAASQFAASDRPFALPRDPLARRPSGSTTVYVPPIRTGSIGSLHPSSFSRDAPTLIRGDSRSSQSSFDTRMPQYFHAALLSEIAVFVKDFVQRGVCEKGSVEYPDSFTGKDIVDTVTMALPPKFSADRKFALTIARSLQQSLWFHEVDFDLWPLKDSKDRVYVFEGEGADALTILDEIPTGVITRLTKCYSSWCGTFDKEGMPYECYAWSCPNRSKNQVLRHPSLASTSSFGSEIVEEAENWESSVPKATVLSLDKVEVARQSLIFELIQGEQKYLNDLSFIETGFVLPLRIAQPPIIPPARLDDFLSNVLLNVAEIREHSRKFLDALLTRQREQYPVVSHIGDIVLENALEWSPAYTAFTTKFPWAERAYKEEKKTNPLFADFLKTFSRQPQANRQGFEHFQTRSTFRGVRYNLLLEPILKKTAADSSDREYVEQALAVIRRQSTEADEAIAITKSKIFCRNYSKTLVRKVTDIVDLDLLEPTRRHFISSKVYRRPDGSGFTEWAESQLILFDHYLVVTKPARPDRDGSLKYLVSRRPVPLELVTLLKNSFTDPAVPRSSGFHLRAAFGSEREASSTSSPQDATALVFPIVFQQIGRYGGVVTYYVDSANTRKSWESKMKEAITARLAKVRASPVVRLEPISEQTFGAQAFGSLGPQVPASAQYGRPTCSTPLESCDGQKLVACGTAAGLFIGFRGRPRSMRQVLHLPDITQCAVLQEHGFILVVAGKTLIAYSLEALVPSGRQPNPAVAAPQKLSGSKDVTFCRVGRIGDAGNLRTLVIYVKKSGVKESVFNALEPVSLADRTRAGTGSRFLGLRSKPESFRTYKDFFIPSSSYSIQFLRSKLAIICARGIEIMNLDSLRTMSLPDFSAHRNDPTAVALAKRCEESQTLGMFRLQDNEFLLCYDDFAFLVDKHGEPLPGRYSSIIDWESKPEQVAFHSSGLIFAFSPTMIEVRHASTGRLVQIITGSSIVLTYDGCGLDEGELEKRIHFSMKVGGYHTIYEIVPL